MSAAESVKEIYKNVIIADAENYSSGVREFTSEQRKAVVEQLGKAGLVSVEAVSYTHLWRLYAFCQAKPNKSKDFVILEGK